MRGASAGGDLYAADGERGLQPVAGDGPAKGGRADELPDCE
ncbi:MAG: hypothetical protein ACOX5F_00915 [Anaerovoracaceae bacterium]